MCVCVKILYSGFLLWEKIFVNCLKVDFHGEIFMNCKMPVHHNHNGAWRSHKNVTGQNKIKGDNINMSDEPFRASMQWR